MAALAVPAGAMVPGIDPVVDVDRLVTADAQSLEVYLRIMESAPDLEAMVPNAGDFANVVYIDPSVAVSGSGASPEDPLKSWTEVTFVEGTAYLQKCGTEDIISGRVIPGRNNILIGAYGEGPRPIVTTTLVQGGDGGVFQFTGSDIVIRDMHLRAPGIASLVRLGSAPNAIIYNNELEDSKWGIRAFGVGNYRILGNIIHNIIDDGIYSQNATGVEVGWNFIFNVNTAWEDPYTPETVASGDSVQFDGVRDWHVHHNVLDRSDSGNKFAFICNNSFSPGLFEHNFVIGPKADGDGGSAVFMATGQQSDYVLRYNTFTRTGVRVIYHRVNNLLVYGNIFAGNTSTDRPLIDNQGHGGDYFHNVFWDNAGQIMVSGGRLANNIIDNRRAANTVGNPGHNQNNLYTTTLIGGASNLLGDPAFVDPDNGDFRLSAGSPAINAGRVITEATIDEDRSGTPMPQGSAPDIGAYEYFDEFAGMPATPTGVTPVIGYARIGLVWDEVQGATSYQIIRAIDGGTPEVIATAATNSHTDSGLAHGETYEYRVAAVNETGAGAESATVRVTLPAVPPAAWAGFETFSGGWVDTGDWLGLLDVYQAPWVYNEMSGKWMLIPEEIVGEEGSWAFSPSPADPQAGATVSAPGLRLSPMGGTPSNSDQTTIVFRDDFPGNALDPDKWTPGGHWSQSHSVSGGRLTLSNIGDNHRSSVHTVDGSFNFHEETYTVVVDLHSFAEASTTSIRTNARSDLFFVLGPAKDRLDRVSEVGFNFGLRWIGYDEENLRVELISHEDPSTVVTIAELSAMPAKVRFTIDATTFSITLEGATFTSGEAEGTSTLTDSHSRPSYDDYHFMVVHTMSGMDANSSAVIESVAIEFHGVPTEWAGYPILEDGWVDTGAMLGPLNIALSPWIYAEDMLRWIYLPEEYVTPFGAWWHAFR